jgi:hypothetical protein
MAGEFVGTLALRPIGPYAGGRSSLFNQAGYMFVR